MSENPQDQPPPSLQSNPFGELREAISRVRTAYEERFTEREREAAVRASSENEDLVWTTPVDEIFDDLKIALFTNQRWHVGDLMDYWSTLLPNYAGKGDIFFKSWWTTICQQRLRGTRRYRYFLSGTGWMSEGRWMMFVRRGGATIAVYIGTQGNDLFVSLRAFIKTPVNWLLVGILALLAFILPYPFFVPNIFGVQIYNYLDARYFFAVGVVFLILLLLARQRLLLPPSNIYLDDVASLETVVYQTLLSAADEIGIERAQFPPFTPLGAQSPRETWQRRF